jgi:AraC-like DNA-binding protein
VDVLTDVLVRSRARGAAFAYTTLRGAGGLTFPAGATVGVHAIVEGDAFVWTDDPATATAVRAGDVVLVRRAAHAIAPRAGAACTPIQAVIDAGRGVAGPDDEPVSLVLLCGAYLFDGDLFEPVLGALPEVVVARPAAGSSLRVTVDLLARAMLEDGLGQQALLDRLLDITLVHVLRDRFAADPGAAPPWFAAASDDRIGPALQAIHADPARPWTVADLADAAALSRAAFARRFTALVGAAPLHYLAEWRMALAREELRRPGVGLAAVAATVGYRSEYAFAAAFKRHHGTAPGRWRAAVAGQPPAPSMAASS